MTQYRHWTCEHGAKGITKDGFVKPHMHPFIGRAVSWWSDLEVCDRFGLGLTMNYTTCDRTEYVFVAEPEQEIVPWVKWARGRVTSQVRWEMQQIGYPLHWFVAEVPIKVEL